MIDIFEFWGRIGDAEHIHPDDRAVFDRVEHKFNHDALPGCFMGPLRTAPVVLLYLSPGFSDFDLIDAQSEAGRERHARMRAGYEPLPSDMDHRPAWEWWTKRTKCFGEWQDLATKIAFLNIGSYHSKEFKDEPLLAALPSSRVSLDWAQSILFPDAEAGRRVVVCLRSAKYWGLIPGCKYGTALFAPGVGRSGHMKKKEMHDKVMRDEVIAAVKNAVAP